MFVLKQVRMLRVQKQCPFDVIPLRRSSRNNHFAGVEYLKVRCMPGYLLIWHWDLPWVPWQSGGTAHVSVSLFVQEGRLRASYPASCDLKVIRVFFMMLDMLANCHVWHVR